MRTFRTDREAGFTLLELLAVLAIVTLSAAAVMSLGRNSLESARVRSFVIEAEAMLRDARTAAIESQSETAVLIDAKGRKLSFPAAGRILAVPLGVTMTGRVAEADDGQMAGVTFLPSGGSTGGVLSFAFRGRSYALRINWLTGRANAESL